MLFDIHNLVWDETLLKRLNIPLEMLPEVRPSCGTLGVVNGRIMGLETLGGVPITGAAGDQQAALFGQACFEKGEVSAPTARAGFLMMQTGETPIESKNQLLTTIAWAHSARSTMHWREYINAGSAIKWLPTISLIKSAREIDELARACPIPTECTLYPRYGAGRADTGICMRAALLG